MRVGRKSNIVDTKKTRSCVVRLEKLSHESLSPTPPPTSRKSLNSSHKNQQQKHHISEIREESPSTVSGGSGMGATSKQPTSAAQSREAKSFKGPIKKRPVGSNSNNTQTTQQKQATNMSTLRANQKIKVPPKANKGVSATTAKAATPAREETPTPTIAVGRSRRAIKPNPKYASDDMVTPKSVRNVGGALSAAKSSTDGRRRKASTSSDDFYNHDSDDEDFDDNFHNKDSYVDDGEDKVYKVDEKESALDSDISESDEELTKRLRVKAKPRKSDMSATHPSATKSVNQASISNVKRMFNTPGSNVRTAPTQLQQLRRSLQSANAQRNQSLLSGSSGSMAQKRKMADSQDSDSESSYSVPRKQMLVTNHSGLKFKMPVKENAAVSNTQSNRQRSLGVQRTSSSSEGKLPLNGGNRTINSQLIEKRKLFESSKASQDTPSKMTMRTLPIRQNQLATNKQSGTHQTVTGSQKTIAGTSIANANRLHRTNSPKQMQRKDMSNSSTKFSNAQTTTSSATQQQKQKLNAASTKPIDKLKSALASSVPASLPKTVNSKAKPALTTQPNSKAASSGAAGESQDDSPNSTMDDFETMPTFTIVNVNDIINKKGDVLITKTKGSSSSTKPPVVEFSESISLDEEEEDDDDDDDDEEEDNNNVIFNEQRKGNKREAPPSRSVSNKSSPINSRVEAEKKKMSLARTSNNNESGRKQQYTTAGNSSISSASAKPQILNHRLGLRNNPRVTAKTTTPLASVPDKPAPRILNSVVGKKTQPVKPMITNLDDSAEESFPLSLDEEETEDEAESKSFEQTEKKRKYPMDLDTEDTESQNTEQDEPITKALALKNNTASNKASPPPSPPSLPVTRRKRPLNAQSSPIVVTSNKKRILTPAAAKENSLAAINQQISDTKSSSHLTPQIRKQPAEKVVISKQGDKIIKKITCFETWYVINMPLEPKRQALIKNQLDIPLINLANNAKTISLPSNSWSCKVTLYELSATTLAKSTFVTYTGDLTEYNINEEDRAKYQPSCVMFRRSTENRQQSRMPYDRAVIFKNKTFSTNIEGKNIRLVGAPSIINSENDIEILLEVVDALTLQSDFVEYATMVQ